MPKPTLTLQILTAALQGLEAQRAQVESHIAEVQRMLGARPQEPAAPAEAPRPKWKRSAAGRRRMVGGAKKRRAAHQRKKAEAAKAKGPAVKGKAAPKKTARKTAATGKKRAAVKAAEQPVTGSAVE